ncbi:cytochrome P450 [Apiospora arundinis]|uniref:Cytochrome P450 n=1 Tax=Apiospora arundinis TaxID=335852 RepID=A0ABR2IHJ9_9PEZI
MFLNLCLLFHLASVVLVLILYGLLRILEYFLCPVDKLEPPLVRSRLPLIGHGLSLLRNGISFYKRLRERSGLPIVTVFLGTQKVYIVHAPELVSQVNRSPKAINATLPFLTLVCAKIFGMHGDYLEELMRKPTARGSLWRDLQGFQHASLDPKSSSAAQMTFKIANRLSDGLEACTRESCKTSVNLMDWLQTTLTLATAHGLYGADNPFARDPTMVSSVWDMTNNIKKLAMWPWPSFTAGAATRGREKAVYALQKHLEGHGAAAEGYCELVRNAAEIIRRHDMSIEFAARYHIALLAAFVINTVPAAFWMIGHIASDKQLAATIQDELDQVVESLSCGALTVSTDRMRAQCPILVSVCQEVLRLIGSSNSTFFVHEDVVLDGRFLLKQGSILQVPAVAIHSNPEIWGPNAQVFKADRFLKPERVHPSANRTFGGGSTLCPGRHLALNELLLMATLLFHTYDVQLSAKTPRLPAQHMTDVLSVIRPASELLLTISRRPGMEKAVWTF